ncbi:hypothetical protein WMY93_027263 [Mugilogobius chulae]|uniref:Uncharacterized protein n=1 Tax=Mugilogobius chulae TaxID=88201 RepID=A0AAW0N3C4_9GOBI
MRTISVFLQLLQPPPPPPHTLTTPHWSHSPTLVTTPTHWSPLPHTGHHSLTLVTTSHTDWVTTSHNDWSTTPQTGQPVVTLVTGTPQTGPHCPTLVSHTSLTLSHTSSRKPLVHALPHTGHHTPHTGTTLTLVHALRTQTGHVLAHTSTPSYTLVTHSAQQTGHGTPPHWSRHSHTLVPLPTTLVTDSRQDWCRRLPSHCRLVNHSRTDWSTLPQALSHALSTLVTHSPHETGHPASPHWVHHSTALVTIPTHWVNHFRTWTGSTHSPQTGHHRRPSHAHWSPNSSDTKSRQLPTGLGHALPPHWSPLPHNLVTHSPTLVTSSPTLVTTPHNWGSPLPSTWSPLPHTLGTHCPRNWSHFLTTGPPTARTQTGHHWPPQTGPLLPTH